MTTTPQDIQAEKVPGAMRCAKCNFRLQRNVIYTSTGNIGAGTSETEPCPNGCGPLWPITWKEDAIESAEQAEKWFLEIIELKKQLSALQSHAPAHDAVDLAELKRDYKTDKTGMSYEQIEGWNNCIDHLAPRLARSVPDGWKLVPEYPTKEMVTAAGDAFFNEVVGRQDGDCPNTPIVRMCRAMLSAAPQQKKGE